MSKTILFVEDEAAFQKSLGFALKAAGYEVISALDGESGIRLAKSEHPSLILLDLILPKMDGFEVLEQLKATAETKEIPTIILTNLERMDDVEKALALGAKTYLAKSSYTLEEIVEKVKESLKNTSD